MVTTVKLKQWLRQINHDFATVKHANIIVTNVTL